MKTKVIKGVNGVHIRIALITKAVADYLISLRRSSKLNIVDMDGFIYIQLLKSICYCHSQFYIMYNCEWQKQSRNMTTEASYGTEAS